jgi:transcriptional regulator with XRE-family HTH domain
MANFNTGELIRTLRKQKGLSQEDFAGGFMDRGNLSKIENGTVTPNKKTLEAIFERLGFDPYAAVNSFLDDEMAKVQAVMDELDGHLSYTRIDEADALIKQLEENEKFMENDINRQYVMCAKAATAVNKKEDPEKIHEALVRAVKISLPVFHGKYIGDYFLSKHELYAINMIAIVYHNIGQFDKAIEVMYGLKKKL